MKGKRSGQKNSKNPFDGSLGSFRRLMHSKGEKLREGLSRARLHCKPGNVGKIVKDLGKTSLYRSALAPLDFPKELQGLKNCKRLQSMPAELELVWTGEVLLLFEDKIAFYVKLRDEYFSAYINGELDRALEILNDIEQRLGVSLWLLQHKLELYQARFGLQSQKDLLENIVSTSGFNKLIAVTLVWISQRAENNVSYKDFLNDVSINLEFPELREYILSFLIPYDISNVSDLGVVLSWTEVFPIIDRFEIYVQMCLLYASRTKHNDLSRDVLTTIEALNKCGDWRIQNIVSIVCHKSLNKHEYTIQWEDFYTEGRYEEVIEGDCENLETVARSYAMLNRKPELSSDSCMRQTIIIHFYDILILSANSSKARMELQKIALLCSGHKYSYQIAGFLERSHDHVAVKNYSELDRVVAFCGAVDNPWGSSVINSTELDVCWLSKITKEFPESPTLSLRKLLLVKPNIPSPDDLNGLPCYRKTMYLGHVAYLNGDYAGAITQYKSSSSSNIDYVALKSKQYLFDCYLLNDELHNAIKLVVDHAMENPSAIPAYDLKKLIEKCIRDNLFLSDLSMAILLHLASKYINIKYERDLSDVYENILSENGFELPSEMHPSNPSITKPKLVYFLKYICIPRILEDSTLFSSLEDVEKERIRICQKLISLDPERTNEYQVEIRLITRDSQVASLVSKIEVSKIYVDESGIRQIIEPTLYNSFSRYQKLLEEPGFAYQTEKISKLIEKILEKNKGSDIGDIKLPTSERESLFNAMLTEVVEQFALNPAYGLDTNISTSIRHGAFEGNLRSPLTNEYILCRKLDGENKLPTFWELKITALSSGELNYLEQQLVKFTERFEEIIDEYLKKLLHIKTQTNKDGMFVFQSQSEELAVFRNSIPANIEYSGFVDRLIAHCWEKTSASLDRIRDSLLGSVSTAMSSAFDALIRNVESHIQHENIAPFVDAVARSRTDFQVVLGAVAEWFRKPKDLSRDPFEVELAIRVALQQINNCYVKSGFQPQIEAPSDCKIQGQMLDGLCEILFILLQNVIIHGDASGDPASVSVKVWRDASTLVASCENRIRSIGQQIQIREKAARAMERYQEDSALRVARQEGGSGLSKVWRIAEYDLKVKHSISIVVEDDGRFKIDLRLSGEEIYVC